MHNNIELVYVLNKMLYLPTVISVIEVIIIVVPVLLVVVPQFFSDTFRTLINRAYPSLEWCLQSPPKPHAFVSLPLQSSIQLISVRISTLITESFIKKVVSSLVILFIKCNVDRVFFIPTNLSINISRNIELMQTLIYNIGEFFSNILGSIIYIINFFYQYVELYYIILVIVNLLLIISSIITMYILYKNIPHTINKF